MATFVLVHGAWHGAWIWPRVARILRQAGHDVYTPTLTGLGERSHLGSQEVNLRLHIDDVRQVIEWDDLQDVVLCGHSYGGAVVTGVADVISQRIASLVYLDAFVLESGQSVWDYVEPMRPFFLDGAARNGGRTIPIPSEKFNVNQRDLDWVKSKTLPMALACFVERLELSRGLDLYARKTYVYSKGWGPSPFTQFYDRFRQLEGWKALSTEHGHHLMLDDPVRCAEILMDAC